MRAILAQGYALPATNNVVCADLGYTSKQLGPKLKKADAFYMDSKTRRVGSKTYHHFGRDFNDIVALQNIAKLLSGGVDREVVAKVCKKQFDVALAYGTESAIVLISGNFNAKVCPPPPPSL